MLGQVPQGTADGSAVLRIVNPKVTKRAPNGPPEATATNLSGAVASQPTGARRNGAKRRSVLAAVGAGIYCPLVLAVARARPQSRARPVRGRPRREAAGLPRGAVDLIYKVINNTIIARTAARVPRIRKRRPLGLTSKS